jgi:hypothetical protein
MGVSPMNIRTFTAGTAVLLMGGTPMLLRLAAAGFFA